MACELPDPKYQLRVIKLSPYRFLNFAIGTVIDVYDVCPGHFPEFGRTLKLHNGTGYIGVSENCLLKISERINK